MLMSEYQIEVPTTRGHVGLLNHLRSSMPRLLARDFFPVRFVINETTAETYTCEIGGLSGMPPSRPWAQASVFDFRQRGTPNAREFNVAMLVPTGVGAEVGGHAGDAGPAARVIGSICDTLVLHPNVVNASDINELPDNSLYVEGSVLCRLMMGTVGLAPVRQNRVLVVVDAHKDLLFVNAAVNSVSAARSAYGLSCPSVVTLDPPVKLRARFACSGRAGGRIEQLDGLCALIDQRMSQFDALAISSVIDVPREFHLGYFEAKGEMINPWGGVEAMLTHALSTLYNLPTAHSPMFESQEIANLDAGIVDPRMAAEAVSLTFLQCILKGLHKSPRIVTDPSDFKAPGVVSVEDISVLVQPDGCLGLPTLAALEQGITVVAVRENRNIMRNDLEALPWARGQLYVVDNYWEAVGVLASIKHGVAPSSLRRPLSGTQLERFNASKQPADRGKHLVKDDTVEGRA